MDHFLCPIREGGQLCPSHTAIRLEDKNISYEELDKITSSYQGKLLTLGVQKLGIYHPQDYRLVPLLFAAFREKIPVFCANTRLPPSVVLKKAEELGISFLLTSENIDSFLSTAEKKSSRLYLNKNDPAVFLLTSGSTHDPKTAILSLGNLYYSAKGSLEAVQLKPEDTWLLSLPLFHVSGLALLFRVFLAKAALKIGAIDNVSHLSLVPTQLLRLLAEPDKIPSLKCLLLGGAPISVELYKRGKKAGLPIHVTYGLTEMSSSVLISDAPYIEKDLLYMGKPLPYRDMKLSTDGEILVKGETLFLGYEKGVTLQEGWFPTKDLGVYREDAGFAITGRKDRLFISGGENIQPEEIERALLSHPAILEAYVIPKEHEKWGKVPVLFLRADKKILLEEIKEFLQDKLPAYKIPQEIFSLEEEFLKPDFKKFASITQTTGSYFK